MSQVGVLRYFNFVGGRHFLTALRSQLSPGAVDVLTARSINRRRTKPHQTAISRVWANVQTSKQRCSEKNEVGNLQFEMLRE